jgi:sigma-B regulation protein RsbU (phosphoserine phosphatase)
MFLAEISLDGTVIYCNAGHPPSMLVRADGSVDYLRTGGMILGPNPDAVYSIGIDSFQPGDLLVLYTDGITEANDDSGNEEYGRDRLLHVLRAARHLDPMAIVDRVFTDVDAFSAVSPPADDQTLVVVKRQLSTPEEIPA